MIGWIALGTLSAPLLAVGQLFPHLGFIALAGLVPLLTASRRMSARASACLGVLVGTTYGCLVGAWIPEALETLGSSPSTAFCGLVLIAFWAKAGIFLGIACAASLLRERSVVAQVMGVALTVAAGEWMMGTWKLGVPVAFLGHSQLAVLGVAQVAAVGGVPLISAWIAAANQALSLAVSRTRGADSIAIVIFAAWVASAAFGMSFAHWARPGSPAPSKFDLLIVQPDISHKERWMTDLQGPHLQDVTGYSLNAIASLAVIPDAVVWPENMLTTNVDLDPELAQGLQEAATSLGSSIITGVVRSATSGETSRYRSSILWIDGDSGTVASFDKQRAIPLLEAGSSSDFGRRAERVFGNATRWPKVEEAVSGFAMRGPFSVTPVLCYEVLFPGLVSARRPEESVVILNLADDSWVSGTAATRLLTRAARFRAIEQRLTMVRVAHGGLSVVVNPFGEVVTELPVDQWARAVATVSNSPMPTFSERILIIVLPFGVGVGVWWLLRRVDRTTTRRRDST